MYVGIYYILCLHNVVYIPGLPTNMFYFSASYDFNQSDLCIHTININIILYRLFTQKRLQIFY